MYLVLNLLQLNLFTNTSGVYVGMLLFLLEGL